MKEQTFVNAKDTSSPCEEPSEGGGVAGKTDLGEPCLRGCGGGGGGGGCGGGLGEGGGAVRWGWGGGVVWGAMGGW